SSWYSISGIIAASNADSAMPNTAASNDRLASAAYSRTAYVEMSTTLAECVANRLYQRWPGSVVSEIIDCTTTTSHSIGSFSSTGLAASKIGRAGTLSCASFGSINWRVYLSQSFAAAIPGTVRPVGNGASTLLNEKRA